MTNSFVCVIFVAERKKRSGQVSPQKGKDMTTVRFAYYLNSECYYESLSAFDSKEWSGFMRSYKIKQTIAV